MSAPRPRTPEEHASERVFELLRAHVPLTLLMDLLVPHPRSEEIYATERVLR